VAIPDWLPERQNPTFSAMSLHGIANALAVAGLTLEDVEIIRIPAPVIDFTAPWKFQRVWAGLDWVADGRADAVYVKGAAGAEAAKLRGLAVGVDLDVYPSRIARVNNGTPRPIIVDESMIEQHFDIVVRFLESTLQAADWAANNPVELGRILERETFRGPMACVRPIATTSIARCIPRWFPKGSTCCDCRKNSFLIMDLSRTEWTSTPGSIRVLCKRRAPGGTCRGW
jgi:2'-hydroxybiphenyl-2-sulfinate desulfinase